MHAARVAQKLGISRVVIPRDAGVGSAIGFLAAPISYEVVRSRYVRLSTFDAASLNELLEEMRAEAEAVVRLGAPDARFTQRRVAYMRYVGQGHEVEVALPGRALEARDARSLTEAFDATYARLYGRTIPGMDVEVLTFALSLSARVSEAAPATAPPAGPTAAPPGARPIFDVLRATYAEACTYRRGDLTAEPVAGPAVVVEDQTTTVVPAGFEAMLGPDGALLLRAVNGP